MYRSTKYSNKHLGRGIASALAGSALFFAACGDDPEVVETAGVERSESAIRSDSLASETSNGVPVFSEPSVPHQGELVHAQPDPTAQTREVPPQGANVILHEEELVVDKQQVQDGGVVLRKDVEEEQVSETVDLRREDVEITRISPEEARQSGAADNEISAESIYIPTTREEAVVEKDVVATGAVAAEKTVESEQETVGATLRSEDLEVEHLRPQQGQEQLARNQQVGQGEEQMSAQQQTPAAEESEQLRTVVMDHLRDEAGMTPDELAQVNVEVANDTITVTGAEISDEVLSEIESKIQEYEGVTLVQAE